MIVLKEAEWRPIWEQIKTEYPRSVWLISSRMKSELGFTVRRHVDPYKVEPGQDGWYDVPKIRMCLDFYDEQQEVYFRLKYL